MEKRGTTVSFNQNSFSAIHLNLISKVEGIDSAERFFSSLTEMERGQQMYGALLNTYCQEKMVDKATALYEKMKELNFASCTLTQNNLMTLYMKLGDYKKITDLYHEMKYNNITLDSVTYSVLITSYSLLKENDSVDIVFQEIKGGKINLTWKVYGSLASHYIAINSFEKAETCLKMIELLMNKHDREPFTYLLSSYADTGNIYEVQRVWRSIKDNFASISNIEYLVMLQALAKLGDFDDMNQCFIECEIHCATFNARLVNVMITTYLQKDMIDEAILVLEKASRKGQSNFQSFELLLVYYLKKSKIDSALKCLQHYADYLEELDWKPDKVMVSNFLRYFEEENDIVGAEFFCSILKKLGYFNLEAFNPLLNRFK